MTTFTQWVSTNITALQSGGTWPDGFYHPGYLSNGASAVQTMALLRRNYPHLPGTDLRTVMWETPPMDTHTSRTTPSYMETAAHTVMGLYSHHQQSIRNQSMHVPGSDLGAACGQLARHQGENGVRRLFARIQCATDMPAMSRLLLQLIRRLRTERIPLDYGRLASDLLAFQYGPDAFDPVRARWGRNFQRVYMAKTDKRTEESL